MVLMAGKFTKPNQFYKGIGVRSDEGLCVCVIRWKKIIVYPESNWNRTLSGLMHSHTFPLAQQWRAQMVRTHVLCPMGRCKHLCQYPFPDKIIFQVFQPPQTSNQDRNVLWEKMVASPKGLHPELQATVLFQQSVCAGMWLQCANRIGKFILLGLALLSCLKGCWDIGWWLHRFGFMETAG